MSSPQRNPRVRRGRKATAQKISFQPFRRLAVLKIALLCLLAPFQISGAKPPTEPSPKLSSQIQQIDDEQEKERALEFLNQVLAPAVEGLIVVIDNPKASVSQRIDAIEILRTMGADAEMAVPSLTQILKIRDPNLRLAAVKALAAIGPKSKSAVPELTNLLKDSNENVRIVTTSLLGQLGLDAKRAIPNLTAILDDPSPTVRKNAIKALTAMGNEAKAAVPELLNALRDQNPEIRREATIALGRMGSDAKPAVNALAETLNDPDKNIRISAATALGRIGADAKVAVPELVRLLKNKDPQLRSFAAFALGKIGTDAKASIPDLTKALDDQNKDVRLNAAGALGRIGVEARSALPQLVKNLQDIKGDVRLNTGAAISRIAGALQDQAGGLRSQDLLKVIGQLEQAAPILEDPEQGFNEDIRDAVRRSISALKTEKDARPFDRVTEWSKRNWILTALLLYGTVTPVVWLIILGWKPLWILKMNDTLQPYTDFEMPLPTGNSLKIPLRFVLFLGWFHYHPRVLDAWVEKQVGVARYAFAQKSTVRERKVHIPIPVVLQGKTIAELASRNLHTTFGDGRQCLLVWGEGGSGKTSIACYLGKWAMANRKNQRLAKHRMLPVLIEQELDFRVPANKDPFREAIRGQLQALIDSAHPISDDFLDRLLRLRRVLVIVDHLSEMSPESRAAIRPGHPDFPANALIVTSRAEESLDRVPKTVIKPLRIEGNRLSSFLEAYLMKCQKRELFTDAEYFDACSQLSKMVGQRNVTVLLAKLYAEQMIAMKSGINDGFLPDNIPDLMLSYLNELNRDNNNHEPENRRVHQLSKIVAWECLKQTYRPAPAKRQTILIALQRELRVDETQAIDWLNHLENSLRIVHTVGPAQDQMCFALDPLAECLAALYWVEHYGSDVGAWSQWFMQADTMPGNPDSIQGLLLAMRDCCLHRSAEMDIPEFVLDELGRRVGLSTELLRKSQVEQRMVRLHPRILDGDVPVRVRAIRELGDLGNAAKPLLPVLVRALEDENWRIRYEVAKAIGAMGIEARTAIPALTERLVDPDRRVACEAISSLGKIGTASMPCLIDALESQISYVRSTAAWVLASFESSARAAVPSLMNALSDPDWQVQWVAAYTLGCIGADAKPAVFRLIDACKGDYVLVAKEASRALWRINGEEADAIVSALGDRQRQSMLAH
ncbi:HEAT repeat domain-containing protein [filamentous cyanobacterium LEGE 11480]|uniref:HEAT repeat domain-containing protein n=1 Tax=Romeriopsis navalis LEGE 11480 TaxID=2777977 RepID=A0A928VIT7_9CYAN|nr:HEAT repeat domain-containing protein [Romeriopsis navalis]MBE9029398.1 HEAT repeat domain-containing protein [Romeriopsis navalis LEGE 11480]